jgi:hypothetical protein
VVPEGDLGRVFLAADQSLRALRLASDGASGGQVEWTAPLGLDRSSFASLAR